MGYIDGSGFDVRGVLDKHDVDESSSALRHWRSLSWTAGGKKLGIILLLWR